MTLYYSLVRTAVHGPQTGKPLLTRDTITGLHAPRVRDDSLHESHRPDALHVEAEALHIPVGESDSRKNAVLVEGML